MLNLLGRYDFLGIYPTRLMCRCPLPEFPQIQAGDNQAALLPLFFGRREVGIPIRLDPEKASSGTWPVIDGFNIAAIIAITLNHRSARLDFLYRILKACSPKEKQRIRKEIEEADRTDETSKSIEAIGSLFGPDDHAFLGEGWGDILLILTCESDSKLSNERLDQIFDLHEILEQDFQVDISELTLTPLCVDAAARSKDYQFRIRVRTTSDEYLDTTLNDYREDISRNKNEQKGHKNTAKNPEFQLDELLQNAGRSDFTVQFKRPLTIAELPERESNPKPGVRKYHTYAKLLEFIEPTKSRLVLTETVISRVLLPDKD